LKKDSTFRLPLILLGRGGGVGSFRDARHGRGLGEALLLDEAFECPVAATAGRDLEHAGLGAFGIEHRPDVEALKQTAPGDVLGQVLDRDAGLHAPDVGLAEHQLVEGNVARGAESDFLNGSSHRGSLRDGRREPLSRPSTRHEIPALLSLYRPPNREELWPNLGDGLGQAATNKIEAQAIVAAMAQHARDWPDSSHGIVTFSKAQSDMVTEVLEHARRHDGMLDRFLQEGKPEDVFVKNIENIQGDERDVILISVGYGPHESGGRLPSMNSGPINGEGGERRLNVLFSRARMRCEVFASFDPGEMETVPRVPIRLMFDLPPAICAAATAAIRHLKTSGGGKGLLGCGCKGVADAVSLAIGLDRRHRGERAHCRRR
jgi:hypothetical protein